MSALQAVPARDRDDEQEALLEIARLLQRIRFGQLQVTIHDGRVVQIDVTERRRFGRPGRGGADAPGARAVS